MMVRTYIFTAVKEMVRYLHALCTSLKNLVINTKIKRKIGELLLTRLLGGILFNNNRRYCNLLRFMLFTKQSSTRFLVDCSVAASKVTCAMLSSFFFLWFLLTVQRLFFCSTLSKCCFQSGNGFQNF